MLSFLLGVSTLFILPGSTNKIAQMYQPYEIDSCVHTEKEFRCVEFVKNYDGDTITVNIPGVHALLGKKANVRVLGIDTPEIKGTGPCEKEAAQRTKQFVTDIMRSGRIINLVNVGKDKYFRILADVTVDGKSLTKMLIDKKMAVSYDGGTKGIVDWCALSLAP